MSSPGQHISTGRSRLGLEVPDTVAVDQPFDVDGLYSLRATLAAHAPRLDLAPHQVEHLLIVASELASNAIRHGAGTGRLRLWRNRGLLYCQVTDDGPGITDLTIGTTVPQQLGIGGRGMWICRQLCHQVIITNEGPDSSGATVTAVLDLTNPDSSEDTAP